MNQISIRFFSFFVLATKNKNMGASWSQDLNRALL